MAKSQTILITGGAGFIGSHVNQMLSQEGYQTVVLDNLSHGSRSAIQTGAFVEGDIGDRKILEQIFQTYPIAAVMHFASFIDVGESVRNPHKYYENNVSKTLILLETMVRFGVLKFVFSSTAAIFGNPLKVPLDEDHPCQPINPYGRSKWMVEQILHDFDIAHGLKFCSLRYFNAAGGDPKGIRKNYQKHSSNLIPLVLKSLKKSGSLTINGTDYPTPDGTCVRDYIHIEDLGDAHLKGLEKLLSGFPSSCYNLGNGKGYSVKEVLIATEKVTGKTVNAIEGPRRAGDPPILVADSKKAFREFGWQPRYPDLEDMIEHAWRAMDDA